MLKRRPTLALLCLAFTLLLSSVSFASSSGEGTGVSVTPPQLPTGMQPMGTNPPPPSNETIILTSTTSYYGNVVWAGGVLYSDKWVKTAGTTIKIDCTFGSYLTAEDATNKTNPVTPTPQQGIYVALMNSSGQAVASTYISPNLVTYTITYSGLTANTNYYVKFGFNTGLYHSGPFKVHVD